MRRLVVLGTLAAAAVLASTAAAVNAPPQTFTDETGDSGTAADIISVAVTNDDHGLYTFTITFATPYVNNDDIGIFVDSDQNSATGDPNGLGADYLFEDDYGSHTFSVSNWSNGDWQDSSASTANVVVASDNKSITMTINKSDLGNSAAFNFFVLASDGTAAGSGHYDDAPSGFGNYSYTAQTVFALTTGAFHDGAARAGGTWTVSLSAVRSDTGKIVTSGASIACVGKEGTKRLALQSSSFSGAGAVCTFRVPKTPKHATVHATVTITDSGQRATKSFTASTH